MAISNQELWRRLETFDLDDPDASLTFTRRLARENGWDHAFAKRVVQEYKRFVYLAMTAGHEVTPSDEVDQAWHLHLTYTHSYWDGLCGEVLGRPLHHGPTKGGKSEGVRFEDQYERTLASYREAFEEDPPADVWPPSAVRFGEAPDFVRVNRQRVWLTPKPWKLTDRRPLALAGAWVALAPPLAAGATMNPLDFNGPEFLAFYAMVCLIGVVGAFVCRMVLQPSAASQEFDEESLDAESVGVLRGGWQGAFQAAMAKLLSTGAIESKKQGVLFSTKYVFQATREAEPTDTKLEAALLGSAQSKAIQLKDLAQTAVLHTAPIKESLDDQGLLATAEAYRSARIAVIAIMGSVLLLGVTKLFVGLQREKPVGFLIIGLIVMGVLTVLMLKKPRLSALGQKILTRLKVKHTNLKSRASKLGDDRLEGHEVATAVGLYGAAACVLPELDHFRQSVQSTGTHYGGDMGSAGGGGGCSGGGGGGCGGGGCGGGCGGCGG